MKKYFKDFQLLTMATVTVMELIAICCGAYHHIILFVGIAVLFAVRLNEVKKEE